MACVESPLVPAVQPRAQTEADEQEQLSADTVDPVVVRGHNDAEQRDRGVQQHRGLHPPPTRQWPDRKSAPTGPANVKARHRRVLIRDLRGRTRAEVPRTAVHVECVDETEVLFAVGETALRCLDACSAVADWRARCIEQARGHQWKQCKAENCKTGRDGKGVAPLREHVGSLQVQNDEHTDRHEEMCRAVIGVERLDEPTVGQENVLHRLFVEQADPTFESNDSHRIRESVDGDVLAVHHVGPELVTGECVDRIEGADDQRFLPPSTLVDATDWAEVDLPRDVTIPSHVMEG